MQRVPGLGRAFLAGVAELVDALDLGSSGKSRVGSSPIARTKKGDRKATFFCYLGFRLELVYETELHSGVDVQTQLVLVKLCGITCNLRLAHV